MDMVINAGRRRFHKITEAENQSSKTLKILYHGAWYLIQITTLKY